MRISDWSSDVCSSDLLTGNGEPGTGSAMEGPAGGGIGPDRGDASSLQGMTGMRGPAGQQGMRGAGQQGMTGMRGAGQQGMARMEGAPGLPGGADGTGQTGALAGIDLPGGETGRAERRERGGG